MKWSKVFRSEEPRIARTGRVRFGVFEFDPATCELRREGAPVRLQSQPAQVLAVLVNQPDRVVTRETLQQKVWGAETFVDFDRGLNFCVAQIRASLGDSAESPRFVRTIPKRGYQFIAPVTILSAPPVAPKRPWTPAAVFFLIAAAVILAGVVRLWSRPHPSIPRLAVVRFDNETGNPDFDRFTDGLTDAVVADLTASGAGRYGVIGNAAILRQPRGQRDLTRIGTSLRAGYVVLGQVQRDATRIRVLAHLIRLPEQTHIWVDRFDRAPNLDDPLAVASQMAQHIAADFEAHLKL